MDTNARDQKVLVIDDDQQVQRLICDVLKREGYAALPASDGQQGLELFQKEKPTIVLTDIRMPNMDGIELLKAIKKLSPVTQVVVISGAGTTADAIEALRLGANDYMIKPINIGLLIHTANRCAERYELIKERMGRKEILEKEVRERTAALTHTFHATVKALGILTEKRDPYTAGHQHRVALLATEIGRKMALSPQELEVIHVAGLLHDIGKVAVPVELLVKTSTLNSPEIQLMRIHPQAGYDIIKDIPFEESLGKDVSKIILQHHERLDGSGYPLGLQQDEIALEAKILSVSDVVEAMSSHRPYRAGLGMERTVNEIESGRGRIYAPDCVDICTRS